MAWDDQPGYWRATRRLMWLAIMLWVALGAGAALAAADAGRLILFGIPVGYMLAAVASPFALVGLVFWFADRQDEIDHDFGVAGED